MPGPAPKPTSERRRSNVPNRGEWVELTHKPTKVPPMPKKESGTAWTNRSRRAWRAWWSDPVSQMWTIADKDLVEQLLMVHEVFVRDPKASTAAEVRRTRDLLGLTPSGRQDRRWKIVVADVVELTPKQAREREARKPRRLRIADPTAA